MSNYIVVLSIALFMVVLPIVFAAFLLGYGWGKRDKALKRHGPVPVHGLMVDLPDDPDEYRVIITHGDKRTVI
jgi:hypothetical protein